MTKWIKCSERMPEKEGYYLVSYIFYYHRFYKDAWFSVKAEQFSTTDNITHWAEIEPPEDE